VLVVALVLFYQRRDRTNYYQTVPKDALENDLGWSR
jgi:hypothetical protein